MNKKFSTLVAGLLLAGAVGTVNAQTTVFDQQGTRCSKIVEGRSYHLGLNGGQTVLVMEKVGSNYQLKMVDVRTMDEKTDPLNSSLWKVSYTKQVDGKYYFTFINAAYNIPLSFSTNKASKNQLTGATEFPGNVAEWEWQEGIEEAGLAEKPLVHRFSNPDSMMVVAEKAGQIGAVKYAIKNGLGDVNVLALRPYEAAPVVLTAEDLNTTFQTKASDKFKLFFNPDVKGENMGNLWTAGLLKAEPAQWESPVTQVYEGGSRGEAYTEDHELAAKEAINAANYMNSGAFAQEIVGDVKINTAAQAFRQAVIAAINDGSTYAEAVEVAKATVEAKNTEIESHKLLSVAAGEIKAKVGAAATSFGAYEPAENLQSSVLTNAITTYTYQTTDGTGTYDIPLTNLKGLFTAAVATPGTYPNKAAAQAEANAVKAVCDKFNGAKLTTLPGSHEGTKDAVQGLYDASVKSVVRAAVETLASDWGTYTVEDVNALLTKLQADAQGVSAAIDAAVATMKDEVAAKETVDQYLASFEAELTGIDNSAEIIAAIKSEINTQKDASVAILSFNNCKTIADAVCERDDYKEIANAAQISKAGVNILKALNGVTAADVLVAVEFAIDNSAADSDADEQFVQAMVDRLSIDAEGTVAQAAKAINKGLSGVKAGVYYDEPEDGRVYTNLDNLKDYVRLSVGEKTKIKDVEYPLYLAVDTNFVTGSAGRRHLTFAKWWYNENIKNSDGDKLKDKNKTLWRDYNGHFNFKFTYYATQDSLVIETDGYAMEPAAVEGIDNWVDMPEWWVGQSHNFEGNGNTVMLAVLNNNHTEVTVGNPQYVDNGWNGLTLNTRIGFNASFGEKAALNGVYTIQFISDKQINKNINGSYITRNWLWNSQTLVIPENQVLDSIPAAQWVITSNASAKLNSIRNRETGDALVYNDNFADVQQQYLYKTATADLYTNITGDSLLIKPVAAVAAPGQTTLGYYRAASYNDETKDQLEVYALRYLNAMSNDLFVNVKEDSVLNVVKSDEAEVYFRLIPATTKAAAYGVAVDGIATELTRQAYKLQLETGNANVSETDKLNVIIDPKTGKYRLDRGGYTPFFLREFKHVDGVSYYALIEANWNSTDKEFKLGYAKVSVKDYPSDLVSEDLEGENAPHYSWGYYDLGRTSTFALVAKDAPKYRRLGVTNAEDGLKDNDTNYAKIYTTRNANRYLYENSLNKVAGYEEDPLGLNFLGDINTKEATKNLALFIDTAYVRNNTARPQYMIALRPDFAPDTVPCEAHPSTHPYDLVDAVHADYLVTLADSVDAYVKKTTQDKFKFDGYTRLAFVPAKHIGDKLIIAKSIFTGTKDENKDTKDLSKNDWKNGVWQFRLTNIDPASNDAEFYIEGSEENHFIRLVNGVAVLTDNIQDAERFNIESTTEEATANEAVEAAEVSVVATQGAIIVKGAAGKVVTVANILGQTIANQVAASDNVTIAAPAGIAVVTVDGEATKVVVK